MAWNYSATAAARKQTPYLHQINGEILQSIPNTPCLGVTLSTYLKFNIDLDLKNVAKSYRCLAFVRRNFKYGPEKLRRMSYIYLIDLNVNIPARSGTHTCARTFTNWKWSSVGLHVLSSLTIVMNVSVTQMLNISTYHPSKTEEK